EVADSLSFYGVHPRPVSGLIGVELLRQAELVDLLLVREVQPMPVDNRIAAEDESHSFEVGESELTSLFETVAGRHGSLVLQVDRVNVTISQRIRTLAAVVAGEGDWVKARDRTRARWSWLASWRARATPTRTLTV